MIKSSVTPMMLSYTDDVEQRTGLAAGRLFFRGRGRVHVHQEDCRKGRGFTGDGFQSFE